MTGAIATHQGDCSNFTTRVPYCCKENPVLIDLTPEAPPETRTANCCRSGVLTASAIDMPNSLSYFDMIIGHLDGKPNVQIPHNLTLLAPSIGYTCSPLVDSTPTTVIVDGGLRKEQAFSKFLLLFQLLRRHCSHCWMLAGTWKSACTYSSFVAKKSPACCVSLSTFYNTRITPCPACSCDCGTVGNVPPQCTGCAILALVSLSWIILIIHPSELISVNNGTARDQWSHRWREMYNLTDTSGVQITCARFVFIGMWSLTTKDIGELRWQYQTMIL